MRRLTLSIHLSCGGILASLTALVLVRHGYKAAAEPINYFGQAMTAVSLVLSGVGLIRTFRQMRQAKADLEKAMQELRELDERCKREIDKHKP